MKGEPIVTPNTIIGVQITADKIPILIYYSIIIYILIIIIYVKKININ